MSRTYTSWPNSAKQAAVTSPTQPAPMTPIGSRESLMRPCSLRHGGEHARALRLERLRAAGDLDHVVLRDPLEQRVRDPVGRVLRLPRDEADPVAVLEDHQLASAHVSDLG